MTQKEAFYLVGRALSLTGASEDAIFHCLNVLAAPRKNHQDLGPELWAGWRYEQNQIVVQARAQREAQ